MGDNANNGSDGSDMRYCWVCFATEEDEPDVSWVQPCNCRGTTKWVHQACLQRWVDEKLRGNPTGSVSCPQCSMEYMIVFPNMGKLIAVLDVCDNVIYRVCPFMAAGVVVGCIYWTATTYGAISMMQIVGHTDAVRIMEGSDPLILLIGLPMIPVALILTKMIRWEDAFLGFVRRYSPKVPLLRHILPATIEGDNNRIAADIPPLTDTVSATRVLCSALLLPTFATMCGKIFFDSMPSTLHKSFMGGLTFLAVKGFLKMYHKQKEYVRQSQRKILDYIPEEQVYVQRYEDDYSSDTLDLS